ncbi:MAG: arylformamidase [Planctomycetaceae bacterium]|nr:arylformamidase [Planctomycetaceae bacterium]
MINWIDITRPIDDNMVCWPGRHPVDITWAKRIDAGHHCNVSHWQVNPHTGTHIDAPRHLFDDGQTIDRVALDTMIGPCCVMELDDEVSPILDAQDVDPHRGLQRLLIRSRHSHPSADSAYKPHAPIMTPDAASNLLAGGLKLLGTDRLSVDASDGKDFALHRLLLAAPCIIVEGLDLADVKPGEYQLLALPLRIVGSEASPARVLLAPFDADFGPA